MELKDEELIYNVYLGNREALQLLYFRYEKKMRKTINTYEFALKRIGYLKEDINALIWEGVSKALNSYSESKGCFFPYCSAIIKMDLIDKIRKRSVENCSLRVDKLTYENDDIDYCDTFADLDENLELKYDLVEIKEKVKLMGEAYYRLFELLYMGYSYQEIADELNVNFKKVCNMVCMIRKKYSSSVKYK